MLPNTEAYLHPILFFNLLVISIFKVNKCFSMCQFNTALKDGKTVTKTNSLFFYKANGCDNASNQEPFSEEGLTFHPFKHSILVSKGSVSIPFGQT